ncbi:hypothetical protein LXL04_021292 [Taraxacum kok-saghyz]
MHNRIGLTCDCSTIEGRRQAYHSFIVVEGAFAYLRDNTATKATIGNSTIVDVSMECAGMLERLMLAQTQECVFENTIAKGSTFGVCTKISRQASLYYEGKVAALNATPLDQHFDKIWMSHVQLKAVLFYAEACYREDVEAVQVSGGPTGLQGELQQLHDLRRVNHELFVQTEELLQKEAAKYGHFRSQFGSKWTMPRSTTLTNNLQD